MDKKKVMIADDSCFMRNNLKLILNKAGYDVVGEAQNGMDAVQLYEQLHPDIVTMDITMPQMNGIEALKVIKKFDTQAKIIMCSSMGQSYYVQDAISNGAVDFIVKPFKLSTVKSVLDKHLIHNPATTKPF